MQRRVGLVAACLALLLPALAGCGGGTEEGSGEGSGDEIVLGFVGALTGPLSFSGQAAHDGMQVAVERANESGAQIELLVRDTGGDATKAVAATRELAQQGALAIYFTTEAMPAVQDVLNQTKVLGLGAGTGAIIGDTGENKRYKWVFSVGDNDGEPAVQGLLDYAAARTPTGVIGELQEASSYGKAQAAITDSLVARSYPGLRLVVADFPTGATSVTRQLNDLQAAGAGAVIAWTYGAGLVQTMKSVGESSYSGLLIGPKGIGDPAVIEAAPKQVLDAAVGGPIPKTFLAAEPGRPAEGLAGEFVERYKAKRGQQTFSAVEEVGAYGFDTVLLVQSAVEKAGSTDSAAVKDVLMSGQPFTGAQGTYEYGPDERLGLSADQLGLFRPAVPCDAGTCQEAGAAGNAP